MSDQPTDAQRIWREVREILMRHWDPIGVSNIPEAADEYDGYVGPVCRLLTSEAPDDEILKYLRTTETETMGLHGQSREVHKKVVEHLRTVKVKGPNPYL